MAPPKNASAKLLYENGANWRYATGTTISDPALYYRSPTGKSHIVVSELEISLMRKNAQIDVIHSFGEIRKALGGTLNLPAMVAWLAAKYAPVPIQVPHNFNASLYVKLRQGGLNVEVAPEELLFPERALKTADEVKKLRAAQKANESAFAQAFGILKAARVNKTNKTLSWQSSPLTAQVLQGEMNAHLVKLGCQEFHDGPIVACGAQGAMPHERGNGPLKAEQLIIIDSFPRHANGYWGDLTRTVIKGKPSEEQANLYNTVLVAQQLALKLIKPGANGAEIHAAVEQFFEKAGHTTGMDAKGNPYGFFHGTGHGVGLELHEPGPRTISRVECILQPGMVTSVEPGLYYPGKHGVRIEDVVAVTAKGHTNLTTLSKTDWIIP